MGTWDLAGRKERLPIILGCLSHRVVLHAMCGVVLSAKKKRHLGRKTGRRERGVIRGGWARLADKEICLTFKAHGRASLLVSWAKSSIESRLG